MESQMIIHYIYLKFWEYAFSFNDSATVTFAQDQNLLLR